MGNAQSNRNPSSVSQCFNPQTHTFSLEIYFKLRRKRESEKEEDGVSIADKIWLTCSALQNFLIDENGDEPWDNHMNVSSDYATNINMVIPCTTDANGIATK